MKETSLIIPSTSELRNHESNWIKSCHENWGLVLMELAGRAAAEHVYRMWQESCGPAVIVCGAGNKGGDGLVVARYLRLWDVPISIWQVAASKAPARSESVINKDVTANLGITVNTIDAASLPQLKNALVNAGVVIDALLGTGLDRTVEGTYKEAIDLINAYGRPILAIDIPSGVNSDTGQIMGAAVHANATVTFGYLKAGLLCYPGADLVGQLSLVDIGLPGFDQAKGIQPKWRLTTAGHVYNLLPVRPANAHKGTFGYVLTIAGSMEFRGAAHLAATSALRTGAGMSFLACPKSLVPEMPADEIIYKGLEETDTASINAKAISTVESEMEAVSAIVLGPGLSLQADTVKFVHQLVPKLNKPSVIDADALNAISQDLNVIPKQAKHIVMTPHPKELARLMSTTVENIQADRIGAATKAAAQLGANIVLKGAHTVVASPDGDVFINPTGNQAMATAGAGDVLSGIIGALLAQHVKPFDAAVAGVYLHGAAGDMAAGLIGDSGIVAGEIAALVPTAISKLRSGEYSGSPLEIQVLH
jgi:NAD(P)H-hydrate epimerase